MSSVLRPGLLVASSGGHLLQLSRLRRSLPDAPWTWVTFDLPDAAQISGDKVVFAHHPTNRNLKNLIRNTWLAFRVVRRERPALVITTGAGVAVPFCWLGRLFGAKVVYVESFARTSDLSLTGRLVLPVASRFYVQWPALEGRHRKVRYVGPLF